MGSVSGFEVAQRSDDVADADGVLVGSATIAGRSVVALVESAGARIQEGALALNGYAQAFKANVALSANVPRRNHSIDPRSA